MTKKKLTFLITIVSFFILFILIMLFSRKTDGMKQSGIYNIKYRICTENNCEKWSKNGLESDNNANSIKRIEIKYKNKEKEITMYSYNEKGQKKGGPVKNINIENGFSMALIGNMYNKYHICYKTFNSKNRWLDWSCDGEINGNKKEQIKKIKIKIIPKNVLPREYLKNYGESVNNIGF